MRDENEKLVRPTQIELESLCFRESLRLHEIEGSPLTDEDIEMFDMFHREKWSNDKCLNHIKELVRSKFSNTDNSAS